MKNGVDPAPDHNAGVGQRCRKPGTCRLRWGRALELRLNILQFGLQQDEPGQEVDAAFVLGDCHDNAPAVARRPNQIFVWNMASAGQSRRRSRPSSIGCGWSGELPHAIAQDVAAKMLMHNITQVLCEQAQQALAPQLADA